MMMVANKESRPKKGNTIGRFLESYILGLMARLADVINDMPLVSPPVEEQRRCVRAMEEMIRLCKTYVRIARPQVRDEKHEEHPSLFWKTDLCRYLRAYCQPWTKTI